MSVIRRFVWTVFWVVVLMAVVVAVQPPQLERLEKGQAAQVSHIRAQSWAEAVTECESKGGFAVPRATAVLGRSADLPACVPQLGD